MKCKYKIRNTKSKTHERINIKGIEEGKGGKLRPEGISIVENKLSNCINSGDCVMCRGAAVNCYTLCTMNLAFRV